MRVLVTGGAGFIGANVALGLAERHPDWEIAALDNLRRRGAELNLPRLRAAGVALRARRHPRARRPAERRRGRRAASSARPSPRRWPGSTAAPTTSCSSNLLGAYNCLELARRRGAYVVFLSTSRVYPVAALRALALEETDTRFELAAEQPQPGASQRGIAEEFPLDGARTLYGTTKLAAELLIEEYRDAYGLRAVVNRCGVIAGPWQMGKVDQGVFTYWMLAHHFRRPLSYIGFGGSGKQVRDLLHVEDLLDLLDEQLADPEPLGRRHGQRRRRARAQPVAARDDRSVRGDHRQRGRDRARSPRPGRATSRSTSPTAGGSGRSPIGARAGPPARSSTDIHAWIREHEAALQQAL